MNVLRWVRCWCPSELTLTRTGFNSEIVSRGIITVGGGGGSLMGCGGVERLIDPRDFAVLICDDFNLPPSLFVAQIVAQMRQQLSSFCVAECEAHAAFVQRFHASTTEPSSYLSCAVVREAGEVQKLSRDPTPTPHHDRLHFHTETDDDGLRVDLFTLIPIQIHITVGNVELEDAFEVDLKTFRQDVDAEMIATNICSELGVGGEFLTAMSHDIRQQVCAALRFIRHSAAPSNLTNEQKGVAATLIGKSQDAASPLAAQNSKRELRTPTLIQLSEFDMERMLLDADKVGDREGLRRRKAVKRARKELKGPAATDVSSFASHLDPTTSNNDNATLQDDGNFSFQVAVDSGGNFTTLVYPSTSSHAASFNSSTTHPLSLGSFDSNQFKTRRTLLFRQLTPLFTGASDNSLNSNVWLRRFCGIGGGGDKGSMVGASGGNRLVVEEAAVARDLPKRRVGRAAKQAAAATISAIASAELSSAREEQKSPTAPVTSLQFPYSTPSTATYSNYHHQPFTPPNTHHHPRSYY